MNRGAYRLFAPGLAFSIVGVLVLWAGAKDSFRLRGSLIVTGLYGLAAQILLSLLLINSIDDFGDRVLERNGRARSIAAWSTSTTIGRAASASPGPCRASTWSWPCR